MIDDGGVFGHACRVAHDRFCQVYVFLDINPSDLYDVYGLYANIVTLKIKLHFRPRDLSHDLGHAVRIPGARFLAPELLCEPS